MDNEFKKALGDYVQEIKPEGPETLEEQMEIAEEKFEQDLASANIDNDSPIKDLKSSKEKEAVLRSEIKRALKGKIDGIEIDEDEQDKIDSEVSEVEDIDSDDEIIVEDRALGSDTEDKKVIAPKEYLNKLNKLHQMKMNMYTQQVATHSINVNEDEFYKTIKYEKYLLNLRSKYSEEEQEAFTEYEDKYKQEEMAEQKIVRDEFKIKTIALDELITELKEINDEIEYVQRMQFESTDRKGGKITEEDAKRRLIIANDRKMKVLAEISILNPKLLIDEVNKKKAMDTQEKRVVGYENMIKQEDGLSNDTKANQKYAKGQEEKSAYTLDQNYEYYLAEAKKRNEQNKYQLYKLKKELKDLPEEPITADDIAKKSNILQQMQEVSTRIDQDEDVQRQMTTNMNKNTDDITAFLSANAGYEEDYKKREKGFKETDEYISMVEDIEGEAALRSPSIIDNDEEKETAEIMATGAKAMAVGAVATGNIPVAAGCALVSAALVRDVNNYDDAQEYIRVAENSEQMNRERKQALTELSAAEDSLQNKSI